MNKEIAKRICEQMTEDIDNLCNCPRKDEKNRACIGCRELAIKTLLDYINQLETNNFKLQARSDRYKQKIIQLEKQLEHYKSKEIERINKDLLQAENDYLERCIKANISGGSNE